MKPERLARIIAFTIILSFMATTAVVSEPSLDEGAGAGPRQGNVLDVEVEASPEEIDTLAEQGYDINEVHEDIVNLTVTDEEIANLEAGGFDVNPDPETHIEKVTGYHSYASLVTALTDLANAHPSICRLISLGQSVQHRELWAIRITDNPDTEEDEPEFKYISTMHGNEPIGMELCLKLIERLLNSYGTDGRITSLVDETVICIVPLMNPDGFVAWYNNPGLASARYNANGMDLNRLFPEYSVDFAGTFWDEELDLSDCEPEVAAIMQWSIDNSFVASANFHGGALVVNYPYDDDGKPSGVDSPSPDDCLFEDIARRYSIHNGPMWNSLEFDDGITNGAAWYVAIGGMQDWSYRYTACNEVTIELSDTKAPPATALPTLWTQNEESMLAYIEAVHIGVRGLVADRHTGAPLWAQITVTGNAQPVFTDPDVGDYRRMLLPGTYTLRYEADGYVPFTVSNISVTDGDATRVDVTLGTPDVDGDGDVDAVDVQLTINDVLELPVPYDCDLDGGGPTVSDLQRVVNAALGR